MRDFVKISAKLIVSYDLDIWVYYINFRNKLPNILINKIIINNKNPYDERNKIKQFL